MVAAAGHLFGWWFSQLLQPLLHKMNPGGKCFCQSTKWEGLEQWISINDSLTDSYFECSHQFLFASSLIDFWIITMQHLLIWEVATSLFTPHDTRIYYITFTDPLPSISLKLEQLGIFFPSSGSVAKCQGELQSGVKRVCWERETLWSWASHNFVCAMLRDTHRHSPLRIPSHTAPETPSKIVTKLYTLVTHTRGHKCSHIGYISESQAAVWVGFVISCGRARSERVEWRGCN